MEKFLLGYKPKPEKRKQTNEERKEYMKDYEDGKRKRQFDKSWTNDRVWLVDSVDGMKCTTCMLMVSKGKVSVQARKKSFLSGCKSYKLESIVIHEKSDFSNYYYTNFSLFLWAT